MVLRHLLRRKRLSFIIIGTFFLLGGVEYAVILPTIWLYIHQEYGAEQYFLGLILSAFSLSAVITGPVMGRLADKFRRPKLLMIVGTIWEIAGNIMYFLGLSKWFIFGGRLVAGVGAGVEAVLIAEISRVVPEKQRTGIISILIATRQFGLLIGPGLNLFLRLANFEVGTVTVNKYNVPGAFMALLWLILCLLTICLYHDLHVILLKLKVIDQQTVNQKGENITSSVPFTPPISRRNEKYSIPNGSLPAYSSNLGAQSLNTDAYYTPGQSFDSAKYGSIISSEKNSFKECGITAEIQANSSNGDSISDDNDDDNFYSVLHTSTEIMETAEHFITSGGTDPGLLTRNNSSGGVSSLPEVEESKTEEQNNSDDRKEKITLRYLFNEYVREEVIAILVLQFNSFFNQVALETMVTPLTHTMFNWGELENSIFYCLAGAEVIGVFVLVKYLSKRVQDRHMVLFGVVCLTTATSWLTYVVANSSSDEQWLKIMKFSIGVILDTAALPFLVACSISLYSKITHKDTQGLSHGIRRSFVGVGTILGPLWAGSMLTKPYIMFGVMLALLFVSLLTLLLSYNRLHTLPVSYSTIDIPTPESLEDNETQPLLSEHTGT